MNEFKDTYFPLPETEDVKKDLEIISNDTWNYINANQITMACIIKPEAERDECRQSYLDLY